jgi:hypothetical protein
MRAMYVCVRACVCVCICVCVYVCTPACKLNRAAALFLPVVVSDKTEREAAERRPSWQGRKRANVIPRGVLCWSKGRSVATLLQTWRTIGCSIAYPMHLRQIVSLPPPLRVPVRPLSRSRDIPARIDTLAIASDTAWRNNPRVRRSPSGRQRVPEK